MRRGKPPVLPFNGVLPDELATCPRLLAHNARQWPGEVALREKRLGIWREITWQQANARARTIALGLLARGIAPGHVVAYMGQNRPDLLLSEIAIHALGGLSLGVYKDSLKDELKYLVNHARVSAAIVEDEEQVDKLLELEDEIPSLKTIVYCDPRGMAKHDDPRLVSMAALCADGDRLHAVESGRYDALVAATDPQADAILCTTSGTTAHPKLAVLKSGAFLRHGLLWLEADGRSPGDNYVSVLPLPWIGEQVIALAHHLLARVCVSFVEEEETTGHDMREIGPSTLLYPPRVWEGIAADIKARIIETTRFKRALYGLGLWLGERASRSDRRSWLADVLLGRAVRDRIGMSFVRSAITGGAPLGPDVFRFFRAIGVPLKQVYGQTETIGPYCVHHAGDVDLDTVGVPFRGVEVRIDAPDRNGLGEIVVRHPGMFTGYYRDEVATRADLRGGWLHTGDAGHFDERGHLVVIDRLRDLAVLLDGDRFSPQYLENRLKFSPYIGECIVIGQDRPFVTAIVCIRHSIVSKWAESRRVAFTTYSDLAAKPEVRKLLRDEVARINALLPESQRIVRFLLLYKELDADDGELTRTRKLRRGIIHERYSGLIASLYDGRDHVDIDTRIVLQDGRTQRIHTRIIVETLFQPERLSQPRNAAAAE